MVCAIFDIAKYFGTNILNILVILEREKKVFFFSCLKINRIIYIRGLLSIIE